MTYLNAEGCNMNDSFAPAAGVNENFYSDTRGLVSDPVPFTKAVIDGLALATQILKEKRGQMK